MAAAETYEFEDFTLDAPNRRLSKGSQTIPLEPKAYDVLLALVRRAGNLVSSANYWTLFGRNPSWQRES
jgi:DNA-binding winged helix-turn-helix (wHTH) protein